MITLLKQYLTEHNQYLNDSYRLVILSRLWLKEKHIWGFTVNGIVLKF